MAMNEGGNASALLDLTEGEKRAKDLGRRISVEAEAWKVAQLAATLSVGPMSRGTAIKPSESVKEARRILAEARRQTLTPEPAGHE